MTKAGYEYLLAYKLTVPIYDYTVEFCRRCSPFTPTSPTFPPLSSTRTFDQMIQAGRSGMQNLPEGYKQKSLEGYIKLTGVARGSLEELLKDYLAYARQNKIEIWDKERIRREIRESSEIWDIITKTPTLPTSPIFPPLPASPIIAVNFLVDLLKKAGYLIDKLLASLEEKFIEEGGFRENLFKKRQEYKNNE
jgi:four helix bundle suffix protein